MKTNALTLFRQAIDAYGSGRIDLDALMAAGSGLLDSRSLGAVYTPQRIVDNLLDGIGTVGNRRVLDPAVGRGAFLIPLLERETVGAGAEQALHWAAIHLRAIDIDPTAVADCRAVLAAWFRRVHGMEIDPGHFSWVRTGDFLKMDISDRFDVIVGNPPYVRFQSLDPALRAWLAKRFASCARGNVDLYHAFIERALELGDRVAFIVPNGFLSTRAGADLRRALEGKVDRIVDFGHRRVFPGVGTYTCLLFLDNRGGAGAIRDDATGAERAFAVDTRRPQAVRAIRTGIATLCDRAYAVRRVGKRFEAVATGMPIEAAVVRPLIKATKIPPRIGPDWTSFILYPYGPDGDILPPTQMALFPHAWAHLQAVRPLLDARDRGKTDRYPQWYAYGRGQGLIPLRGPEALIIPAMMGGNAQPRHLSIAPLLAWGGPLLVSGYAVDAPGPSDIEALLSDRFRNTVAQHGAAKPGKPGADPFYAVSSWMVKGQS